MAKLSDGSLTTRNEYNAFGEVATNGVSNNSIGYTGQRLDNETGLMALGNGERYYSPQFARFIQQDSFAGLPNVPQSLNRYSYVHNNPNKFIDPSGHAGILATIGLGALIGGVAGGALEFAHQTVDVITGERKGYDLGGIGKAAATGAVIGAVIGSFGLLAGAAGVGGAFTVGMTVGGVGVGAASVAVSIEQGRYGHAAVDAVATLLPFAFKGVRTSTANSFKEFYGSGYTGIRPPGMVTAREAWARIVRDTKGEIASVKRMLGRDEKSLNQGYDLFESTGGKKLPSEPRSTELGEITSIKELMETGYLPGDEGVTLTDKRIRFGDLYKLSTNGRKVEFALSRETVNSRKVFRLYSGSVDGVPTPKNSRLVAHTHPTEGEFQSWASNADHIGLANKYERLLQEIPSASPRPSRIVYGEGDLENRIIYEGFNKSTPKIEISPKGKRYYYDEKGNRVVIH